MAPDFGDECEECGGPLETFDGESFCPSCDALGYCCKCDAVVGPGGECGCESEEE